MRLNDLLAQVGNLAEKFGVYTIINTSPEIRKVFIVESIMTYFSKRRKIITEEYSNK